MKHQKEEDTCALSATVSSSLGNSISQYYIQPLITVLSIKKITSAISSRYPH